MGAFVYSMLAFFALIGLALAVSSAFLIVGRRRRNRLQDVLVRYNDSGELDVLLRWIDLDAEPNLLDLLEYLEAIGEHTLAARVFEAIGFDRYPNRHIRMTAWRCFRALERNADAMQLARALRRQHPNDDAVLDIFCETALDLGLTDEVRQQLRTRLEKPVRGTVFARHRAHLAALDGDVDIALDQLTKIELRERTLFQNTLSQQTKSLLERQLERTRALILRFEGPGQTE